MVLPNVETTTTSIKAPPPKDGAAFHDLTKAYQEMATRNAANLTSAIQALAAIKTPAEFLEVQTKLIKDGIHAAVADGQNIAHLTEAVFTAAFEPVRKQIEQAQQAVRH